MEIEQVSVLTISPIYVPIELKTGVDRSSVKYVSFKKQLKEHKTIFTSGDNIEKEYESIEHDSWEHRLFIWQDETLSPNVLFHVFPNNIAIVVIEQKFNYQDDVKVLENEVQQYTNEQISQFYPAFVNAITGLKTELSQDLFNFELTNSQTTNVFWISRTLLLRANTLSKSVSQKLITKWLNYTYRPIDAQEIISGEIDCSLTWLNYVIVDLIHPIDERLESMILAQYYYSAQECCNKLLKHAIDSAYNSPNNIQTHDLLSKSRVITRLHEVDYHEHLKYLTRTKREYIKKILECWDFEQLTKNGQRMIVICSSKIEDTENKKREKSSLTTDLLLVALSFFTVFELSLYLTELSREMMSRPALDFNDDSRSFILQFIAGIDTDVMFSSGFFLTLLLVFIYKIIKSR